MKIMNSILLEGFSIRSFQKALALPKLNAWPWLSPRFYPFFYSSWVFSPNNYSDVLYSKQSSLTTWTHLLALGQPTPTPAPTYSGSTLPITQVTPWETMKIMNSNLLKGFPIRSFQKLLDCLPSLRVSLHLPLLLLFLSLTCQLLQ